MANILPRDLTAATSVPADAALIVDDGTDVLKATPLQVVNAARPLASEGDAAYGADNAKIMTPLRVRQAIQQFADSGGELSGGFRAINPADPPYNADPSGNTAGNQTAAVQSAIEDAAAAGVPLTCGPDDLFAVDTLFAPPGFVGWDRMRLIATSTAQSFGLRAGGTVGLYIDGRDIQASDPGPMRFRETYLDANYRPAIGIAIKNGAGCDIDGITVVRFGSPVAHQTSNLLYDNSGSVVAYTAGIDATQDATDFRLVNWLFDCMPQGTFNAANQGPGAMISLGGEATPFPYTGPDFEGTTKTEIANVGIPRATDFYRQFGLAIPIPRKTRRVEIGYGTGTGGYYGVGGSGVEDVDLHDFTAVNNIRSVSIQNGNLRGKLRNCRLLFFSSVGVLTNFDNREMEISGNYFYTDRVAGAAPIQCTLGVRGFNIHDNTTNMPLNSSATNPEINGNRAKAQIAVAIDVEDVRIHNNRLSGFSEVAHISVASGLASVNDGSFPLNFATNFDTSYDLQSHIHSDGISIVGNTINGSDGNAAPAVQLLQLTDDSGTWELKNVELKGTVLQTKNHTLWLDAQQMTDGALQFTGIKGNPYIEGTAPSNINIPATALLPEGTRQGNAGDPGTFKLEDQTFGSVGATFPGGPAGGIISAPGEVILTIWDLATGAGPARVGNDVIRNLDGSEAEQRISFTATSQTNTTRTGNEIEKTGGVAGVWDAAQRTTVGIARADKPTLQARHRAGAIYALGLDSASGGAADPAASKIAVAVDGAGQLLVFVGDFSSVYNGMGISIGDGEVWTVTFSAPGGTYTNTIDVVTSRGQTAQYVLGNPTDGPTAATLYPIVSMRDGIADVTYVGTEAGQYPAAGTGWTQIATASPTGVQTVSFTGIADSFEELLFVVSGVKPDTTTDDLLMEVSHNGSTWSATRALAQPATTIAAFGSVLIPDYNQTVGQVINGVAALGAAPAFYGPSPSSSTTPATLSYRLAAGVQAVRFSFLSNNFASGSTFTLFGK